MPMIYIYNINMYPFINKYKTYIDTLLYIYYINYNLNVF